LNIIYRTFSIQGVIEAMNDRRQRDKEQTIREVLTAATQLFSENGLHGTSIRDIEKASGVSKGLIMHHFETKENLYAAVQDNLNQAYVTWMAAQRDASKDLLTAIESGIKGSLSYLNSNEEFRRINLWSYLEGQERTTDLDKRFTASLIESMRNGQEAGLVRDDVQAFVLPFIIRGAIDAWIRSESLREELLGGELMDIEISDNDLVDTLVKLMIN
jgi:TetR/AcrR family transcriptional regulator